ncbi:MAG: hypothetical protein KatS3mg124_0044 [Porticoccaceae bacterium]|nr:MAG: hypothetical protein KatS3mg124_0044 [Porticoccaceae bacterium]
MSPFTLRVVGSRSSLQVEGVTAFSAADASGRFALLPGHASFLTALPPGIARFDGAGVSTYLGHAGGILHLRGAHLALVTRRYVVERDYRLLAARLADILSAESRRREHRRANLERLEATLMERLRREEAR